MNILLADDHELVRETIANFISHETGFRVDRAHDFPTAEQRVRDLGPFDLVILDYIMPGMDGLKGLGFMLEMQSGKPVALLSGHMPDSMIVRAFSVGAWGYLPKTMALSSMIAAIRMIHAGNKFVPASVVMGSSPAPREAPLPKLSDREAGVLRLVCRGMTNPEIAQELHLHEATIKIHVKSICTKIEARNRTEASIIAREAGFF